MEKIKVSLENCYGIRKMDAEFDFSKKNAQLVYAPNGAMKSSFAKTFHDHSIGQDSSDRIYPLRQTVRSILNSSDQELAPESIFVIEPYDPEYQSERVSTLLVNKDLKAEYDQILKTIDDKKAALLLKLKKISGLNKGLEDVISVTISKKPDNFLRALDRVRSEVLDDPLDSSLTGIKYGSIFNEKVEKFLQDPALKAALAEYTEKYEALLEGSRFFRKGVFNHSQASEIAKQLKNHGFFQADHKVYLHSESEDQKVETEHELEKLIEEELDNILSDEELKAKFESIDRKLTNKELRDFREFLLNNQPLIPRIQNIDVFKEDLLKSYLMSFKDDFKDLMDEFSAGKKALMKFQRKRATRLLSGKRS